MQTNRTYIKLQEYFDYQLPIITISTGPLKQGMWLCLYMWKANMPSPPFFSYLGRGMDDKENHKNLIAKYVAIL